jgi:hypothetical protein
LLKLSKNLNNSISQENGQHNSRKPLVESIKFKGNSSGSLVSSKIISIGRGYPVKQSFKGGVKQSIGNDSDLDFDLELDWSLIRLLINKIFPLNDILLKALDDMLVKAM